MADNRNQNGTQSGTSSRPGEQPQVYRDRTESERKRFTSPTSGASDVANDRSSAGSGKVSNPPTKDSTSDQADGFGDRASSGLRDERQSNKP